MTQPNRVGTRATVLMRQQAWASGRQLSVSEQGYLANVEENFFAPLSSHARRAFESGSGCELVDGDDRPAKMRALHSSSALVVNAFDYWTGRDVGKVLCALGIEGRARGFTFEEKLPTGAPGTPPNLDLVIPLSDGRLVGIESKFTEWITPKRGMASSLDPYVDGDASYWSRAGLPGCHKLIGRVRSGHETYIHLDVPQLLKHALGLARASRGGSFLRYLYLDAPGMETAVHRAELGRFEAAVGHELGFPGDELSGVHLEAGAARKPARGAVSGIHPRTLPLGELSPACKATLATSPSHRLPDPPGPSFAR